RKRRPGSGAWVSISVAISATVLLPILAIALTAMADTGTLWAHGPTHALPPATTNTLPLLLGAGIIETILGTGTAWLVTAYDFPGRGVLEWALLLPLAVPTYIMAYAYMDVLSPLGWIQETLRALLGYTSPRQFRLPDIRAMWGAVLLFGFVLYPY